MTTLIKQTRIDREFARLKEEKKKGFIAYITAGDPTLKETVDIVLRLEDAGVDMVELGIPFSDPLADGKVNQDAACRALEAGATLAGVFECISMIRRKSDIPLFFYSYVNMLMAQGFDRTVKRAAQAGIDGFLMLDVPVEESAPYLETLNKYDLNNVTLVTPTSPEERIKRIVSTSSGFVYCVSREGVTGAQDKLSSAASSLVRRTRKFTDLPIALGFGISSPEHARNAARLSDAVIVGSAIVNRFHEAPRNPAGRKSAASWVKKLVNAVKDV